MIINDPTNAFNWAYKGFQYPPPKSWKYAIRLEDQIQWLMQAIMALNDQGVGVDYLNSEIAKLQQMWEEYTNNATVILEAKLQKQIDEINQAIAEINAGIANVRNVVTGERVNVYVSTRQMWDMLRTKSMTYAEVDGLGKTYDELHADGHSYYDIEMFANVYYGDGQERAKFTPTEVIPTGVIGYRELWSGDQGGGVVPPPEPPEGDYYVGTTYGELHEFGFIYSKKGA